MREAGGLHVIGTERHESAALTISCGAGLVVRETLALPLLLSLGDNLLRIFGGERVAGLMNAFRVEEDMPIESGMLTRSWKELRKSGDVLLRHP